MEKQNEKKKKKPFLIIFICILMIALGLAAGIFISNHLNKSHDRTYDNNAEDIKKKNDDSSTSEEVADNIAIPCWDTLVMTADSTEQEVNFYNPEKNENCDFLNNPVSVSLLSDDRKPQIRFLGNRHSGSGNLYHKSFRM